MRCKILSAFLLFGLIAFAESGPAPILKSHNDVKLLDQSESRTEDLQIFADGRVKYKEAGNYTKRVAFEMRLAPQRLQRLTLLLNGKEMRAVPEKIESQIKVLDGRVDKRLEIHRAGKQQIVEIENFYPQLNGHRPAYPRVLVELECMLQDIQRKAAKRPPPNEIDNWCPEVLGKQ
jgi:hypothetical protein